MRDTKDIIKIVCQYLNENKIPYVLIGGVTIPLIGTPRTTVDVDILINILPEGVLDL